MRDIIYDIRDAVYVGDTEGAYDLTEPLLRSCEQIRKEGVSANEALKRVADFMIYYSQIELPDSIKKDLRQVGLFLEKMVLENT